MNGFSTILTGLPKVRKGKDREAAIRVQTATLIAKGLDSKASTIATLNERCLFSERVPSDMTICPGSCRKGISRNAFAELWETLSRIRGIVGAFTLDRGQVEDILGLEQKSEKMSLLNATRSLNQGVREVLKKKFVLGILHDRRLRHPPYPLVVWMAGDQVVGAEVWTINQTRRLRKSRNARFICDNFVVYPARLKKILRHEILTVFPQQPFPELERLGRVEDVVSASPSVLVDLYLKQQAGWDKGRRDLGTIILGFNPSLT